MMATVRKAAEADIPRIIELYGQLTISKPAAELKRQASPDDYREVFARIGEQPGHELVVVEEGGEVSGTMVFLIVPNLSHKALPWALIENMVIDQKLRRGGTGKLLIDYALKRAREAGCYKIQLLSSNPRKEAHAFYRSMGFKASARGFRLYL